MKNNNILSENTFPFLMTEQDLKKLGLDEVGYVKKYSVQGKTAWVLHAADGTALAVQSNRDAVRESAEHKEINIVAVH